MKTFQIASIIALATVSTAQLANIPSCALQCFLGPLGSDGCSELTDFACHCKKGAELLAQVKPCVEGACSSSDQATTISAVESTCQQAGAPISIPDASAAPSSAASAASSAASAASSAASSAAEEVSSAIESAASSLASAASSVLATVTSAGNSTATATPTASSTSEFTGAAAQATKAAGLIGAAAIAMLAL